MIFIKKFLSFVSFSLISATTHKSKLRRVTAIEVNYIIQDDGGDDDDIQVKVPKISLKSSTVIKQVCRLVAFNVIK